MTGAVTVSVPLPRLPADDLPSTCRHRPGWQVIAADGRAHPSTAVRRRNPAVPVEIDPFVHVSFPVVAAFRHGTHQARRTTTMPDPDPVNTFARELGRRVGAAREKTGHSQSRIERDAALRPCTVTEIERGNGGDVAIADLWAIADALGVHLGELLPET